MKLRHLRNIDLLYAIIWVVVALLYLLDIVRGRISGQVAPELDLRVLGHIFLTLLPFFLLFLYNNYPLLPRLLLPGHTRRYLLGILTGLAVMITYQYLVFSRHESLLRHRRILRLVPRQESRRPRPHRSHPLRIAPGF
ncbi:MAG: hypothetical protein K2H74_05480 [Paramuribaculum sp.]|nr:hypothetical protein [Paramuribaculum sp.]